MVSRKSEYEAELPQRQRVMRM